MEMVRSKECAILNPGWQNMNASLSAPLLRNAGKGWLILMEAKERAWKIGPCAIDRLGS